MIKRMKDYSYRERLERLGLAALLERRIRRDLIETFKIRKFLIIIDCFLIFLLKLEIYCQGRFQKISLLINWIFFSANRVIYFSNKLPDQFKNSISVENFKIRSDDSRKKW